MSFLPQVYEELSAASDVLAFVEDRIYRHGEAPEAVDGNYITWFVVTGTPENVLDETPRVDRVLVQVDCWGNNDGTGDEEVEELAQAVRDTIEPNHYMNAVVVNGKDPETRRYRIGMTFTWHLRRDQVVALGGEAGGGVIAPVQAMQFDGVDRDDLSSCVLIHPPGIAPATADGSFKYKIKLKREREATVEVLIGIEGDTTTPVKTIFHLIYIDENDNAVFYVDTGSSIVTIFGTTSLQAGVLYTIEAEWTGTQLRLLINGVQEGATPAVTTLLAYDNVTPLSIGAASPNVQVQTGVSPYPFKGILADAELWIGGLRVGYWPLGEVVYNATPDGSGNGHHGILIGTVKPVLVDSPFV